MLVSKTNRVERQVVEMEGRECAEVDCVHEDVMFGVEVKRVSDTTYFGLLTLSSVDGINTYCPYHSTNKEYTGKALQKQEEAEARENYDAITSSELLPTFRVSDGNLIGPADNRSVASLDDENWDTVTEHALEIVSHVTTDHPLLLVSDDGAAFVLSEDEREIVARYTPSDAPSFNQFKDKFGDVEWVERDYYVVKTANITNVREDRLRRAVDNVVERSAYRSLYDEIPWEVNHCPACSGRNPALRGIHRVILDGQEELVPFHVYNRCKRYLGVINRDLVDEEALDFR